MFNFRPVINQNNIQLQFIYKHFTQNNMKKKIITTAILHVMVIASILAGNPTKASEVSDQNATVVYLTNETFKQLVFNYEKNQEWKYEGTTPAIVDFYADWCSPCRQLAPILDEIAKEYSGKVIVYKVDTVKEQRLSQSLGISSLPTLLFIPAKGQPQAAMGALPKETLVQVINDVLLIK